MPDYIAPPAALVPGSLVWAYLRDSGGDGQERSISQQESEITAYCARYGLVMDHAFVDEAKSGGSTEHREAFLEMIDFTENPNTRPAGLLLWNFARFARNLDDSGYYKSILRKRGLVIHSLTDPIPEGTYGRVIETLIDISNEEKRRQNSRDVKRALQGLFKQGYSFGTPPRGYLTEACEIGRKRDGQARTVGKWVPDPELWELVQLAWTLRAEGKSYRQIIEATQGRIFNQKTSWNSFFKNKSYLGIGKWGSLEIPDHHPAAITGPVWLAVQNHQEQTRRPQAGLHHPRTVGNPTLLSGLSVCYYCGSPIIKDRMGKTKWDCYLCSNKRRSGWHSCEGRTIGTKKADAAVIDAVLNCVLTPDFIQDLLTEVQAQLSNLSDLDKEQARIEKDLSKTDRAIANLLDLVEKTASPSAVDRLRTLEAEQARLLAALQQVEYKRQIAEVEVTPEALDIALQTWRDTIITTQQGGDIRALKGLLTRFVVKVELGYNIARIWYSFPFETLYGYGSIPRGGTFSIPYRALLVDWSS